MGTIKVKAIQILEKEYLDLLERHEILKALERFGVDNWEGYNIAMDYLEKKLRKVTNNFAQYILNEPFLVLLYSKIIK